MPLKDQLLARKRALNKTVGQIADLIGGSRPHLSKVISGKSKSDPKASTLEAIADALDAQWVLVPKHLMPEVERLLSGKPIGPDKTPSSMELLFKQKP